MQTAEGFYYTDTLGGSSNDPIVLIHGIGGNHGIWPASMRTIPHRRILAIDLPGHGKSEGNACRSVEEYASKLDAYLRSARIYRAIFVGYSLGGQIALQYSLDHPQQCAGLGLIAFGCETYVPSELFDLLGDSRAVQAANRLTRTLFFAPHHSLNHMIEMEKKLFSARKSTLVADWKAFSSYTCPDLTGQVAEVPIWLYRAEKDRLISSSGQRLLMFRRSNTLSVFKDHCGHGILAEQPEEVSSSFLLWLTALKPIMREERVRE